MNRYFNPTELAQPFGSYSQGVEITGASKLVYVAGQVGVMPDGTVPTGFEEQVEQVFENLNVIVEDAGGTLGDVVKLTVFITDWAHFGPMNEICLRWFSEPYPARTPVKTELPGALFMADAVVALQR